MSSVASTEKKLRENHRPSDKDRFVYVLFVTEENDKTFGK